MLAPIETWKDVLEDPELFHAARDADATDVAAVARLRKRWSADLVAVALDLASARRQAREKFAEAAGALIADAEGVEQATSLPVARYKASKFVAAAGDEALAAIMVAHDAAVEAIDNALNP